MSEPGSIGREFATQRALSAWALAGALDEDALRRAGEVLGPCPSDASWRRFLDRLGLYLGALLLGAGVICFIAFNWQDLGKFAKLYGMQALLAGSVGATLWLGTERAVARALLLLSSLLLGALFALIGQTYQTGADTWQLFAVWAALMLPFALAGRWAPLWLLWAAILNLALYLYFDTGSRWWGSRLFGGEEGRWFVAGAMNLGLLALWEFPGQRWPSLRARLGPRLLLIAGLLPLTLAALVAVIGDTFMGARLFDLLAWLVLGALLFVFYRWLRLDLAALALLALAAIAVGTVLLGRLLFAADLEVFALLVLTMAVIGASAGVALWLLALRRAAGHD